MKNPVVLASLFIACGALASPPSSVLPTQVLTSGTNGLQSFGVAAAVDESTLVIGAPHTDPRLSGAAYLYARQPDGTWTLEQKLLPPIALSTFGYFGASVAVNDDTVVISGGTESAGSEAYVYRRGTNDWVLEQIIPARGQVAVDADTLVIADYSASVQRGESDLDEAGAAAVYTRSNGVWTLQQRLTASDARESDYFGRGVAVQGNTIVIGAIGDLSTSDESGAAYVFQRTGTNWTQTQKLRASDPQRAADFGRVLALKGDLLAIGAPGYVDQTDQYKKEGFVYVFARSGDTWTEQQKLSASDAAPRDGFGVSVAVTEHQVVVGQFNSAAPSYTELLSGSAYVFRRHSGSWTEQGKLAPNAGKLADIFGLTLAADRDTIVVGDPTILGSAYLYEGLVLVRLRRHSPGLSLSFSSESSRTYTVQGADSIQPEISWETVTTVTGDGSVLEIPIDPAGLQRFYRVLLNQ